MAQSKNNAALKAEVERKLARENLERRLRLERERKPVEAPGVKIPQFLSRNALARGLTNLNMPNLVPLRDAILSLSDPSFLNKKFNQDVYRELPQRVKDFIGLPANQVTRAVIINKIIEAVKIAKNKKEKNNANNAAFNRGVANALVKVAPNNLRVATTNTGTNVKPVAATTTTPPGPPPPPATPPPPMQPINKNANKKAQAKNAAEAAAEAAINRQIRLIENNLGKVKNSEKEALKAEFETLKTNRNINKLTNFSTKVKSFQKGPEKAASGQPNRSNTPAVATMETQTNFNNAQAKLIANLQAKLEQAQQDVAQGKVNANAKVAQLAKKLNVQIKATAITRALGAGRKSKLENLQQQLNNTQQKAAKGNEEAKAQAAELIKEIEQLKKEQKNLKEQLSTLSENKSLLSNELRGQINKLTTQLSEAPTANQITQLKSKIGELTANKKKALNDLANYEKTLAGVMKNKKTSENMITNLQTKLTELQGISEDTKKELSAKIKQLEQNRNASVAAKQEANALVKKLQMNKINLSEELQGKITKLQGELTGSQNVTKTLTNQIANLTAKKETALAQLQKAKTNLATTRSKLNAKNKNLTSIKSQLANRETEIQNLKNVSEQLKASLLTQVQAAKALTDKMIKDKANAEERARKFAALMKKFSNELKPQINSATLKNINELNTSEYKNIESNVKAAINKRKVELYKNELKKRTTNLANLRAKLAQIPSGTEGKNNLSTEINTEEARRKRVAPALNFRAKVNGNLEKNIPQTVKNQIKTLKTNLPQNDDQLLKNLAKYESNYREIFGKPKKFIFFNKVPANGNGIFKASNMTIPNIKTFQLGAMGNAFTKQLQQNFATINSSFGDNPINVFFVGPSGSGKTTLFKQYTDSKNLTRLSGITVYKPELEYDMNQGILYFNDEVKTDYDYSTFAREFIRPTPFNPQSSRAHMSIEKVKNRRVFDLAGKESPVAISELALGFNVFNGNYWKIERTSLSTLVSSKSKETRDNISNLLTNLGISNTVTISKLDELIVLFIYFNFITVKKAGTILGELKNKVTSVLFSVWQKNKQKGNSEFGFEMFKGILKSTTYHNDGRVKKSGKNAKLSEYFSSINTKSDLIDLNFIANYDSYKANIVKEFELSNKKLPKDLQGNTTVVRYIFEMMKRVFEGVYITRSLFSLKFLFDPSKTNISKNLAEEFTIAGINENMRFGMKVKTCKPDRPQRVKCLFEATGQNKEPLYTKTQVKITNNRAKNNFVVLPLSSTGFKYYTSFYNDIVAKNFKNCLIGVISDFETLESKVKQQRQSLEFFKKI